MITKELLDFFDNNSKISKSRIIFFTLLAGISYNLILLTINQATEIVHIGNANNTIIISYFFIFMALCALYILTYTHSTIDMTAMSEEVIQNVRIRLINKIRHTELRNLEEVGATKLYTQITKDTELISQGFHYLMKTAQSGVIAIGALLYMLIISPSAFLVFLSLSAIGIIVYQRNYTHNIKKLTLSRKKEAEFFHSLNDIVFGFKEIKVNYQKNQDIYNDSTKVAELTQKIRISAESDLAWNQAIVVVFYFLIVAVTLFILPSYSVISDWDISTLIILLIFIFGPIMTFLRAIPNIMLVNIAITNLNQLEAKINNQNNNSKTIQHEVSKQFKTINFNSVAFQYKDQDKNISFTAGPINLNIRQGEILFIVGGNGSGKSTILKLLTGLYYPIDGGNITLDDEILDKTNYQSYRELFSIIYTDFHLFDKLYGLKSINEQEIAQLLRKMDMHRKTQYIDDRFTNIDLSTGQKKRLAYIVAMLDNKPICVFDEWAADQDPKFRRFFYESLLEELKAMGKTIIAVTHDDRWFDKADRILKMEEGRLVKYS
ncbi:MAG: cyclic peptide export ABC transporter [Thiomargarita sp.]|nr:cyclic peptide export ABC transporter [Thiomargarita sp.]